MDESLAEALKNQLQLGSEIQRPGSQPAPNLLQGNHLDCYSVSCCHAAAIAEANHFRSASAFPSFDVDCLAGMSNTLPATSSPAPAASLNSLLSSASGNEYLSSPQTQQGRAQFPGNMEYRAAFQAAYQAALMQQNPSMMVQQPGLGLTSGNFGNGLVPPGLQPDIQGIPSTDPSMHSYFTQSHPGPGMDYGGGQRFDMFEDPTQQREEHVGRRKRFNRPRDRDRDLTYPNDYDNQYFKFSSIEEIVGQVMQVAQDQNGCRFLQRKFDEGGAQTIAYVFSEIVDNIVRLMKDPFGNYLIQKLLDRCSEDQRTEVVKAVAEKGELVAIALSTHGTRAVQKLIETLKSKEQRTRVIDALKPGVVHLIKDLNGNHVIQRCLQRLGPEDSQFIYDAAIRYCVEIASHRHGCCVLQRCIDFATDEQKNSMIMEISANALVLSQDAFGNYVVQYVLDLGQPEASQRIMTVLTGHYSDLAIQKFSSNVVEKCLKLQGLDDARESIIREIMASPSLPRLLQDPYGNYVIQSALTVTSGSLHQSLVDHIQPFLPTLRGTPHGKRILQKVIMLTIPALMTSVQVLASLKDPYTP